MFITEERTEPSCCNIVANDRSSSAVLIRSYPFSSLLGFLASIDGHRSPLMARDGRVQHNALVSGQLHGCLNHRERRLLDVVTNITKRNLLWALTANAKITAVVEVDVTAFRNYC